MPFSLTDKDKAPFDWEKATMRDAIFSVSPHKSCHLRDQNCVTRRKKGMVGAGEQVSMEIPQTSICECDPSTGASEQVIPLSFQSCELFKRSLEAI